MKAAFIGIGRMGQAMVTRLLAAKHDVAVFNRTIEKSAPLVEAGATAVTSIGDAARYSEVIFTMLSDDDALHDVVFQKDGLLDTLPAKRIHICAGTHGIPVLRKIKAA